MTDRDKSKKPTSIEDKPQAKSAIKTETKIAKKPAKKITKKQPAKSKSKSKQKKQDENVKKMEFSLNLNKFLSKWFIYLLIAFLFLPFILSAFEDPRETISMSQMVRDIREEKVEKLIVAGTEMQLTYKDQTEKITRKEDGQQALQILESAGIDLESVNLDVEDATLSQMAWEIVLSFAPILLMAAFFMFMFRQARGQHEGMMGIGKSKAKLFVKGKQHTKFKDVGGMDEAKKELEEIVDFMKNPKKYTKVGARTPKGVLLVGPAGTGKTLLARAVAGEANVQFLSIAGSEFMEMLVGVGASRVRDLFATAKKMAPAIIFIDEIDAVGRARGNGSSGGHDEREQTLNQILVEMDGFDKNENVIVMAATNRGDMLDQALIRPGRFDRRVMIHLPDLEERKFILKIHAKGKPFTENLKWDRVAKRTVGFSGADIENMLNEAAIAIAGAERKEITMEDIEEASLKVKLGPSKKRLQDKQERSMTAFHEAGHAVIAHVLPGADPVHRISIISRGRALGYTLTPPERDKLQITKSEMYDEIAVMMGGRAAEMLIFNEQTAGASNDIERATRTARSMVVDYGMSKLGPMNFSPQYDQSYAKAWGEPAKISNALQEQVDTEIIKIIDQEQKHAARILTKYRKQLDIVAERLLDIEAIDGDEFERLMGMKKAKPKV